MDIGNSQILFIACGGTKKTFFVKKLCPGFSKIFSYYYKIFVFEKLNGIKTALQGEWKKRCSVKKGPRLKNVFHTPLKQWCMGFVGA
jgi:hypothetical protein